MSKAPEVERAELQNDPEYLAGDQAKVDHMYELTQMVEGGTPADSMETPLQRTMREAMEGTPLPDPEGRAVAANQRTEILNPDGSKFSWGQEVKPEDSIEQNPGAYEINEENRPLNRQEEADALETNQDIIDFMAKEGVHLDDADVENMSRLAGLGEHLGFTREEVRAAFGQVVRSPIYGQTFDYEGGFDYLTDNYCQGNVDLAVSVIKKAQEVLGNLDDQTRAYLDETGLGNHPDVIVALSNFAESKLGSALDDPSYAIYDED